MTLEVLLPSGLRGGVPLAVTAGGAAAAYTLDGDVVRLVLPPRPGEPGCVARRRRRHDGSHGPAR